MLAFAWLSHRSAEGASKKLEEKVPRMRAGVASLPESFNLRGCKGTEAKSEGASSLERGSFGAERTGSVPLPNLEQTHRLVLFHRLPEEN